MFLYRRLKRFYHGNTRSLKAARLLCPLKPKVGANGPDNRRLVYAFQHDGVIRAGTAVTGHPGRSTHPSPGQAAVSLARTTVQGHGLQAISVFPLSKLAELTDAIGPLAVLARTLVSCCSLPYALKN